MQNEPQNLIISPLPPSNNTLVHFVFAHLVLNAGVTAAAGYELWMCRDGLTDLRLSAGDWGEGTGGVRDRVVVVVGDELDPLLLQHVVLGQGGQEHLLLGCGGIVVVQAGVGVVLVLVLQGLRQVLDLILLRLTGQQWIVRYWCSGQLADVDTNLTALQ